MTSTRSHITVLSALMFVLTFVGCGTGPVAKPDGFQVRGKILLSNGSPLAGGTLVLRPVAGIHGASAQIGKDGSFDLVDADGQHQVVSGKYQVFVRFMTAEQSTLKSKVHPRYQNTEDGDSDLVVDIQGANSELIIRLKP